MHGSFSVTLPLIIALAGAPSSADGEARQGLQRIEVPECRVNEPVSLGMGALLESGAVQPRDAVTIDAERDGCWLLRTPRGPTKLRWQRPLLNARPGVAPLIIDPGLRGVFDIHVEVRAVDAAGDGGAGNDAAPMAFQIALDDGSRRELVGAKGFRDYHFDTEVFAGRAWDLSGRTIILSSVGKPVYLYGFRFMPAQGATAGGVASRWLATDHVNIAVDPERHFAFPGVARMKNGDLVVVYREASIHMDDPEGKISLSRSTDGGRNWLPRVTAVDRAGIDDRDPAIFQMSDGTAILTFADCLCVSGDNGLTWGKPRPTPVFGPRGAVEDEGGHIVYGGLQRCVQRELTKIEGRAITLQADAACRSRDKGMTWERVGVAAYTAYMPGARDFIWYDEPFMCVMPRRYWIFAARVDLDGLARIIRSSDRGATWEPIITTSVWGYPQHLLPLRDGRLLMSYGYRRPPYGIRACLSSDCGKTWDLDNEIVIRMDGGTPGGRPRKVGDTDLGYPASIQLEDDTILTVYYHNRAGSNCFIAGTFWRLPPKP
ncbi:MAG TPA: sialidase family protein [Verrucomicrobiae bacterium]|nr:sialidase family protein [Verrucomicrobiae bacterium]